jgi:iron complex transport system substrate-binding protein
MLQLRHFVILAGLATGWLGGAMTARAADGGNGTAEAVAMAPASLPAAAAFPRSFTDGAGRSVKIAAPPKRIISLSPAITEMVLAAGGDEELVGVTRYCTVPDREPPVARVGGLLDPDYEQMAALKPDLVLAPNLAGPQLLERLESLGFTVVVFNPEGLDNLPKDFRLMGEATGWDEKSNALAAQFEKLRTLAQARLQGVPMEKWPTAVIIYGPDLLAPAPGAFAGQLLQAAGARNVVPAGGTAWQELSPEALLKLNPEIIFLVRDATTDPWPPTSQPALQALTAVQKGRVVDLPGSLFLRPGALQGEALWLLAHDLHPKQFPETSSREALGQNSAGNPQTR